MTVFTQYSFFCSACCWLSLTPAGGCCVSPPDIRLSVCVKNNLERREFRLEPFITACLFEGCHHFCSLFLFFFLLGSKVYIYCLMVCGGFFLVFRLIFQIGLK